MALPQFPLHRFQVVQGSFLGGPPRLPAPFPQQGAVQASAHGGVAQPLPATVRLGGACGGQRLPQEVQLQMEAFFKTDFSDVRVHVGPEAAAIGALAFTHGSALYFAPGQYNPASPHGQRLLGHELAHVVQQRAGRVRNPFGAGVAIVQDPLLEAEAERLGGQASRRLSTGSVQPKMGPAVRPPVPPSRPAPLQRCSTRVLQKNGSTTESHRKARSNSISKEVPKLSDQEEKLLNDVIAEEKKWSESKFVFYSAAGIKAYALHRLVRKIWIEVGWDPVTKPPSAPFQFLRAPGTKIDESVKKGVKDFLKNVVDADRSWIDHKNRTELLSANISLFGNFRVKSESTLDMFQQDGLFDLDPKKMANLVQAQLQLCGLPEKAVQEVVGVIQRLGETLEIGEEKGSALYQIFVPKDKVGDLVYICGVNGIPLEEGTSKLSISSKQIKKAIQEDKFDTRSAEFTRKFLEAAQSENFWMSFKGAMYEPQARILMNPEFFATPNEIIHINGFSNLSRKREIQIAAAERELLGIAMRWRRRLSEELLNPFEATPDSTIGDLLYKLKQQFA